MIWLVLSHRNLHEHKTPTSTTQCKQRALMWRQTEQQNHTCAIPNQWISFCNWNYTLLRIIKSTHIFHDLLKDSYLLWASNNIIPMRILFLQNYCTNNQTKVLNSLHCEEMMFCTPFWLKIVDISYTQETFSTQLHKCWLMWHDFQYDLQLFTNTFWEFTKEVIIKCSHIDCYK